MDFTSGGHLPASRALAATGDHQIAELGTMGRMGFAGSKHLADGEMTQVYAWVFGFESRALGSEGTFTPPYTFRSDMLNIPSQDATEAAWLVLTDARSELEGLERDQASMESLFQGPVPPDLAGCWL